MNCFDGLDLQLRPRNFFWPFRVIIANCTYAIVRRTPYACGSDSLAMRTAWQVNYDGIATNAAKNSRY